MKFKIFKFKKVESTNNSAIRIIKIMYFDKEKEKYDADHNLWLKFSLTASTLLILMYFIFPSYLIEVVSKINII